MSQNPQAVLVTGASGGIGRSIVMNLLDTSTPKEAPLTVIATDLQEPDACEFDKPSKALVTAALDVSDPDATSHTLDELSRSYHFHALVNAAGVLESGPALETSAEEIERLVAVNALGVLYTSQFFARIMSAQGPSENPGAPQARSILTIASNAGTGPRAHLSAYGASKAFASHYTRSLGLEIAAQNIRCNVLCPGSTQTPMLKQMWGAQDLSTQTIQGDPALFRTGIPLGRIADAQDIAGVASFLLSEEARHITLAEITVDGGASQR